MQLKIGVLFPNLTRTYGDYGNIICLKKRTEWQGIETILIPIQEESEKAVKEIDMLLGGGMQDKQQEMVVQRFSSKMRATLQEKIEADMPSLLVCGSFQIMGRYFEIGTDKQIPGLGILDCFSTCGKNSARLTGNLIFKLHPTHEMGNSLVLGFENHAARTFLGKNIQPLGHVISGFGNNGKDKTEGIFYKNVIGTYAHGPLLPKNPFLADWLIAKALILKYQTTINLKSLEVPYTHDARISILKNSKVLHKLS